MLRRTLQRLFRKSVTTCLPWLGFDFKFELARAILRDCGFGSGAPLGDSNEECVFELVKGEAPVLFDVGAHTGEYTLLFKRRFPQARVFCFEPSQENFARLGQSTAALSGVDCRRCALGKEAGEATLYRDQAVSSLASLTKRRLAHYAIAMEIEETVAVTTVDRFLREQGIAYIDLMKIDVEGHELDVLEGAAESLGAGRIGVVQFEFGGCNLDTRTNFQDFFYFFTARHDFKLFVVTRYGLAPVQAYREIYEQYQTTNFVAVRG